MDASLDTLGELLSKCETWISVDNFFPHLANLYGKKGIVLWGQSDPNIFGYQYNLNLLKSRSYLREKQFDIWEACEPKEDAFLTPQEVLGLTERRIQ
jgi:ADP-heptose:LPS heptosyltransferase